ncbi:MAG: FHA domain-containing protein [Cyanobacteria bacterium P01_A01_bin.17]
MTDLILEWIEGNRPMSEVIHPQQASKNQGGVRLGRDPERCDIVLNEKGVSGLHIEIFYDAGQGTFYMRSRQENNPPILNGQAFPSGEVPLISTNSIQLGQLKLIAKAAVPSSVVASLGADPPIMFDATIGRSFQPFSSSPLQADNTRPISVQPNYSKIWLWIIAGIVAVAGGVFSWVRVQHLPIKRSLESTSRSDAADKRRENISQAEAESRTSSSTQDDSFQDTFRDLVNYTHDNNLFTIEVPRAWELKDSRRPNEVIVNWTDLVTGSEMTVTLFRTHRSLDIQELGQLALDVQQNSFGERPNFQQSETDVIENQFVRVDVKFSTPAGTLMGITYARQFKRMISVVSIYVLESEFDESRDTMNRILESYHFFPEVPIPSGRAERFR